jgi:dienelactone hydrolase
MIFTRIDARRVCGRKPLLSVLLLLLAAAWITPAAAEVQTREMTYSVGDVNMQGYLAWDDAVQGKRPGVLVVHEWWGHNDYARLRARMLAELGYTALALDMYGDGKVARHPEDAQKFVGEVLADMAVARDRFDAALEVLKADETVDAGRIAAIGYCFGGAVVLHMMLHGADLDAVAAFHGSLPGDSISIAELNRPAGRIAVYAGEADPMITADGLKSLAGKLDDLGADYQIIRYPLAKHSFTNPGATEKGREFNLPLEYNELADQSSWDHMQLLLQSVFAAGE